MSRPTSTYRLQLRAEFGFDDVAGLADYLGRLGVTEAYLSPILQAAPGSAHGYDVVDHAQLSSEAGGLAGFRRMIEALRQHGLRAIADIVPNHMAVPTPLRLNRQLWAVLRDGPDSEFADWFDLNWATGAILMPVLGNRIGQVLADGQLSVDRSGPEPVLRYFEHEFPLRKGTDDLPLPELLARQWYRLAWWRVADEELNYRRFFDVDTLAAVRVEDPAVFDATHAVIRELIQDGSLTGLRIDHPDGLADPRGYLRQLAAATDGTWVAVEKILEGAETLPPDWACAGTTGYDALNQVGGLFVDPAGAAPLTAVLDEFVGAPGPPLEAVVDDAKRLVIDRILSTEVTRLIELGHEIFASNLRWHDHTRRSVRSSLVELLVALDRYRAYVVPGEPAPDEARLTIDRAVARARPRLNAVAAETLDVLRDLLLDGPGAGRDRLRAEFVVRFQQLCGPVMAKGLEDTTFYRYHRLISLNEVGADPAHVGVTPDAFHAYADRLAQDWPATMTTLSTHDTKRSEDVRARLAALAELPHEWSAAVREWHRLSAQHGLTLDPHGTTAQHGLTAPQRTALDPQTEYLVWQTLVGTWSFSGEPPATERITGYLAKATREAKLHTSWVDPDTSYDASVAAFATGVLADPVVLAAVGAFCAEYLAEPGRVTVLGQKLVQLTMPGVADIYQGTEIVDLSLVDPDNRRPVDYQRRSQLLTLLDEPRPPLEILAALPATDRLDASKLLVTSRALRLRRDHPECFVGGSYLPVSTSSGAALAFGRGPTGSDSPDLSAAPGAPSSPAAIGASGLPLGPGDVRVITVATRLPVALERQGGWGKHTVALPEGGWTDLLTGRSFSGGSVRLAELLSDLPVALLYRDRHGLAG